MQEIAFPAKRGSINWSGCVCVCVCVFAMRAYSAVCSPTVRACAGARALGVMHRVRRSYRTQAHANLCQEEEQSEGQGRGGWEGEVSTSGRGTSQSERGRQTETQSAGRAPDGQRDSQPGGGR